MRGHVAAWLAWPLWAVCLVLALLNLVLNIVEPASLDPLLPRPFPPPVAVQFALTLMAFPTVGALIASRHPSNPIGWLICGVGVTEALRGTAGSYARYAVLARPGSLPAGEWVAWFGTVASGPTVGLFGAGAPGVPRRHTGVPALATSCLAARWRMRCRGARQCPSSGKSILDGRDRPSRRRGWSNR